MNPAEARPEDYNLYYNRTWMRHSTKGLFYVRVNEQKFRGQRSLGDGHVDMEDYVTLGAKYLEPWWPRGGSFNTQYGACYITRRAQRNMRKSATGGGHYIVTYGSMGGDPMSVMAKNDGYMSIQSFKLLAKMGKIMDAAVTRDIIVAQVEGEQDMGVYFRGIYAGRLNGKAFDPVAHGHPMSKRAAIKLHQAGIL